MVDMHHHLAGFACLGQEFRRIVCRGSHTGYGPAALGGIIILYIDQDQDSCHGVSFVLPRMPVFMSITTGVNANLYAVYANDR